MTFLRYLATQVAAYGMDMGLFLASVYLAGLMPLTANLLSKSAAGGFAFVAHQGFTFQLNPAARHPRQMQRYVLLLLLNLPASTALLWVFLAFLEPTWLAKVVTDFGMLALNFWLSRTWVFVAAPVSNDRIGNKSSALVRRRHQRFVDIAADETTIAGANGYAPIVRGPLVNGLIILLIIPVIPLYVIYTWLLRAFEKARTDDQP